MYIHLGNDVYTLSDDVIGVFDLEATSANKTTVSFLAESQKKHNIIYVSQEMPKTFVVCANNTYVTNVSHLTINKRLSAAQDG